MTQGLRNQPHPITVRPGRRNHDPQFAPARLRRPSPLPLAVTCCVFAGSVVLASLFYFVGLAIAWAER